MKTLYLEKRGCDFFHYDPIEKLSDVGNYRVCTPTASVIGKDGNTYFLEFGRYNKRRIRTTNKRTGAKLKHPVIETVMVNALHIDTCFSDNNGSWRNCKLENELSNKNYTYTLADILKAVNDISVDKYGNIEFIDR